MAKACYQLAKKNGKLRRVEWGIPGDACSHEQKPSTLQLLFLFSGPHLFCNCQTDLTDLLDGKYHGELSSVRVLDVQSPPELKSQPTLLVLPWVLISWTY